MLRTSQERVMRRADELGVSLAISDDYDWAIDTRAPLRGSIWQKQFQGLFPSNWMDLRNLADSPAYRIT